MRAVTEIGHRREVNTFSLRAALVTVAKEAPIKLVGDEFVRVEDVVDGNRAAFRVVPDCLAPLLDEVGVTLGLLEYAPDRVKEVPTTTDQLLAWCRAHPNRLLYARPANSGPGRTFIMGLPYLLGDSTPKDPINGWTKTWDFLKQLGGCIEYYPSGTAATMKELGEGSRDMIISTTGWDINPRVLGIVPKEAKVGTLKGFHWVSDAHYMVMPNGIAPDKAAVVLDVMAFLMQREQQAFAYDEGYLYPGPTVKDVPLSMAPPESQKAIEEFGRPEYDRLIADNPIETPLGAKEMVAAFKKWDEEIGAAKQK